MFKYKKRFQGIATFLGPITWESRLSNREKLTLKEARGTGLTVFSNAVHARKKVVKATSV